MENLMTNMGNAMKERTAYGMKLIEKNKRTVRK